MKKRILAIDDSLTLREFIQRSLTRQSEDYAISLAKDGTEGLSLAASELPDLILLDFILPDMKGDEVCRRLQADKKTAGLPVVLMSSSAADIKRTQSEYENVIRAIAKPFTPDVLCSTVAHALRETGGKIPTAASAKADAPVAKKQSAAKPAAAPITDAKFSGDTRQFSLLSVLLALEQDHLTGVLQLTPSGGKTVEFYVQGGHAALVTTRDPAAYLRASGYKLTQEQIQAAGKAGMEQTKSGLPLFSQFAADKLIAPDQALALCRQTGYRLFAPLWTAPGVTFNFASQALPAFAAEQIAFAGTMSEWAMESLRFIGDDFRSAMAWGEPTGIPAYTRKGYERIQQIPLSNEELAFAGHINPQHSLAKIAANMKTDVDHAQRILHRFMCLEVFDYWPASLLQNA